MRKITIQVLELDPKKQYVLAINPLAKPSDFNTLKAAFSNAIRNKQYGFVFINGIELEVKELKNAK